MGSGFAHGKINPETGINTRLEDFRQTLSCCIDRAIAEPVDLVLFGGDAFPDATPPPYVHEAFASQFRRLADAGIAAVLLVGNHDQHTQGAGGASLCIYRTLGVPGIVVGDRLQTHRIQTQNGAVQVVTLPWLTRSNLLTRPETEGLSLGEVNRLLLERLRVALEGEIRQLDPTLPTVLLAHLMVDTARFGAERFLAVGKGFTVPLEFLTRSCFDYVALGHVHCHQVLSHNPPVVYPGSIERVDFSEARETKGYVFVNLAKGETHFEFCPLSVRAFHTLEVDLSTLQTDPQPRLMAAIQPHDIQDAVVRLVYHLRPQQVEQIDGVALHQVLAIAHTYTIQPNLVSQLSRPRLPELGTGVGIHPLEALQAYIDNRDDLDDISADILTAAQQLIAETDPAHITISPEDLTEIPIAEVYETQLRLL